MTNPPAFINFTFRFHDNPLLRQLGFLDDLDVVEAKVRTIPSDFPNWHSGSSLFYCEDCGLIFAKVRVVDCGKDLKWLAHRGLCIRCGEARWFHEPPGSVWLQHDLTYRHGLPDYVLRREAFLSAHWRLNIDKVEIPLCSQSPEASSSLGSSSLSSAAS